MTLYTENIVDQNDHLADVFVYENVVHGYDVVTTLWRLKILSWRHFV